MSAVTLEQALRQAIDRLKKIPIDTPELDARLLLQYALNVAREYLLAHRHQQLSDAQTQTFFNLVARREAHEPVSRILGTRGFWSLDFALSPATLDPRSDSETLIEAALGLFPDKKAPLRILDLGTGSGCLILSLLHEFPNAMGLGIDLSPGAVTQAIANASHLNLLSRAQFQQGIWTQGLKGSFDLIVSNPPYIPTADISVLAPEVRQFDPLLALDGGPDGLAAYRTLIPALPSILKGKGYVILELGMGQELSVSKIFQAASLRTVEIRPDLAGIPRAIVASF